MEELETLTNDFGEWVWPQYDAPCRIAAFQELSKLKRVIEVHCKGHQVAVQAGGNCGIFPFFMSGLFERVYTFEPDPLNFVCLCHNAPQLNVFKYNAALGDEHELVDIMAPHPGNCGALQVVPGTAIPTLKIDDLWLKVCDLIYMDIEGRELAALHGAGLTLKRCKPVVVFEDKGVGFSPVKFMEAQGYQAIEKIENDVVMVCL